MRKHSFRDETGPSYSVRRRSCIRCCSQTSHLGPFSRAVTTWAPGCLFKTSHAVQLAVRNLNPGCVALQNMSGPGIDAAISLPPLGVLQAHDTFELDFQLSCPGTRDKDCPIWDHTLQLFVCCEDPTATGPPCGGPCNPTVWTQADQAGALLHPPCPPHPFNHCSSLL